MMKTSTKLITFGLLFAMLSSAFVGCDDKKDPAEGTTGTAEVTTVSTAVTKETATETEAEKLTEAITSVTTVSVTTEQVETEPEATEGLFMIDYAENVLGNYTEYDQFIYDDTEPVTRAVLYTDGVVKDLKFLSLSNPGVDENGMMTFDKTELFSHKYITKDRPMLVTLTFYGDIPTYGVSVTDAVGATICFAITMSGEDGSLILTEIG